VRVYESCNIYEGLMAGISMRHVIHTNGCVWGHTKEGRIRASTNSQMSFLQLSNEFPATFRRVSYDFQTSFLQIVRKRIPEMIPKKLNVGESLDEDA